MTHPNVWDFAGFGSDTNSRERSRDIAQGPAGWKLVLIARMACPQIVFEKGFQFC